jgi:hypothetical protein
MLREHPTEAEIRDADAVLLFDDQADWKEIVGEVRSSTQVGVVGYYLRIPVDSTDSVAVLAWRDRIEVIRGELTETWDGQI